MFNILSWEVLFTFLLLFDSGQQQTSIKDFRRIMVANQSFTAIITLKSIKSFNLCVFQCHQQTSPDCEGIAYDDSSQICEIGSLNYYYEVAANGKYVYTSKADIPDKVPHLWLLGDGFSDYSLDPIASPVFSVNKNWLPPEKAGMTTFSGGPYRNGMLICAGWSYSLNAPQKTCYYYQAGETLPERKSDMVTGRSVCGVATVKGDIWLAGGVIGANFAYDYSSEIYVLSKDAWVMGPKMPYAAFQACLTAIDTNDQTFLYIGGFYDVGVNRYPSSAAAIYDWTTQVWTNITFPGAARGAMSCARITLRDGTTRVMVAGGTNLVTWINAVYTLDPNSLQWRPELSLLAARAYGVLVQVGPLVYYLGGCSTGWATSHNAYQVRVDGNPTAPFPAWVTNSSMDLNSSSPTSVYGFVYNV